MDSTFITGTLREKFKDDILSVDESYGILTLVVNRTIIHDLLHFIKEEHSLKFNVLTTLCGVHYPEQPLPLGVVYHLYNVYQNIRIRIKTFVSVDDTHIRSVTDIFAAANWMERETYDFYGILFDGHPNLKRILNVDYLDYFPMRKEFPLEDATREDKDDRFFGR